MKSRVYTETGAKRPYNKKLLPAQKDVPLYLFKKSPIVQVKPLHLRLQKDI